jgi:lipopolysaccharide/colanic/teichoic acid biosynthesis glycosyltransferase
MTKRLFDVSLALLLLVPTGLLLLVLYLLVRLSMGTPVFFRQKRPGMNERLFTLVKFRTMSVAMDDTGKLLPDEKRMTMIGKCLRATSLDELPELWNILRGDMSFVGPRPLLVRYLRRYSEHQARRHEVRPGLTGWAQVNGRNATTWEDRLDMDVWYVDNQSLWLDLRILWRTAVVVFRRKGVNAKGQATMPEFRGTRFGSNEK